MEKATQLKNVETQLQHAISHAKITRTPYAHWSMDNVFPEELCNALVQWKPNEKSIAGNTQGKRENNNQHRVFITPETQQNSLQFSLLANVFEMKSIRTLFAQVTGSNLNNTSVRLELCHDKEGFWLEPHTDVQAKKLTFLISLSTAKDAESWGTDIMNPQGESLGRSSGKFNSGFLFIPAKDTWHGYQKRPMNGIRRTLIMNYVDSTWRAKNELAFPIK
ncbi:hypothetical protein COMNV_01061 [Commensalibacter sp. Nvir]|uniref:2OG-Fe(II) oxygenase n=1 Tax=Commensalibacter sp. Nvir TaxID=3069817 RepID=UPI002D58E2E1|nr:hypothetical protein COMNV_01061 [Commensalibacter sp. Nvir]